MNINIVVYHPTTGEMNRAMYCQEVTAELQAGPDEAWMIGQGKPWLHYVDLSNPVMPQIRQRMQFAHTVNVSGQVVTVSNLPLNCRVLIDGQSHNVPDGTLEIEFDLPGRYTLTLEHHHYLTATVSLNI